jgi:diguanylate cyclase (GGDEF)-like protein
MKGETGAAPKGMPWRRWTQPGIASACWVAYAVVYVATYWLFGDTAATLACLPVAVVALFFGVRAGVIAGVLAIPVTGLLTYLAEPGWRPFEPTHVVEAVPDTVALVSLGVLLGRLHDLADKTRRQADELQRQALHDVLTGLANRALFKDRLNQTLYLARRHSGSAALLLMDLDDFKQVNDTLGHHAGDLLLKEVSTRLVSILRQTDTVARLGGDEFAVVVPEADSSGAMEVVRKCLKAFENPFLIEGQLFKLAASIGVSLYPEHGADADTLLRRADIAMYIAKRAGSGYATSEVQEAPASPAASLVSDLRRAVSQRELVLHYQPQVDLGSGRPVAMEALLRWEHPERGLVAPGEFIHLCERSGLIVPMTEWVIDTALRQCHTWQAAGLRLPVLINLTLQSLVAPKLPETLKAALETWQIDGAMVGFEVTENTLMKDPERVDKAISRLRQLGVRIFIDDFGTGYTSLACLHRVRPDGIKLDRSFVSRMASDPSFSAIVGSLVRISHDVNCTVVAEGVEDRATWELLDSLHCDSAQGFFTSAPIPSRWVNAWLERACGRPLTQRAKRRLQDDSVDAAVPLRVLDADTKQQAAAV